MIPCSNIAYAATRPIPNLRAISSTDMRLLWDADGAPLRRSKLGSAAGSDMGQRLVFCVVWFFSFVMRTAGRSVT